MKNQIKTGILLGFLTVLILTFGELMGGQQGLIIAFIIAIAMIINSCDPIKHNIS